MHEMVIWLAYDNHLFLHACRNELLPVRLHSRLSLLPWRSLRQVPLEHDHHRFDTRDQRRLVTFRLFFSQITVVSTTVSELVSLTLRFSRSDPRDGASELVSSAEVYHLDSVSCVPTGAMFPCTCRKLHK